MSDDRHVTLVELFWTRAKDPRVPLGHASLLAALRVRAPEVRAHSVVEPVNATSPATIPELAERILAPLREVEPGRADVALGVYVWAEHILQQLLPELRRRGFQGRVILGGPQISYATERLERLYPNADLFVRGYGEDALVALARGARTAPGVHVTGEPDRCEQAAVDLEALPSPWLEEVIALQGQRFVRWETQRGCQFRCSFCQHREAGQRLTAFTFSWERVRDEIDLFCDRGIEQIAVLDPIFNRSALAVPILRRFLQRGYQGHLSLQCRAELVDSEDQTFLDLAAELDTTLEFGLQTIHREEGRAVQRPNHMPKVHDVLAQVRRRGIDHEVSLIFGLPHQTLESFEASVQWCLDRRIPTIKAFPLMLLRGTRLERERDQWGLVEDGAAMPRVIASDTMTPVDHRRMEHLAQALRDTEGHHPRSVEALYALQEGRPLQIEGLWSPITSPKQEAPARVR